RLRRKVVLLRLMVASGTVRGRDLSIAVGYPRRIHPLNALFPPNEVAVDVIFRAIDVVRAPVEATHISFGVEVAVVHDSILRDHSAGCGIKTPELWHRDDDRRRTAIEPPWRLGTDLADKAQSE